MSSGEVDFEEFKAEVAPLLVDQHGAPSAIADFVWSQSPAPVDYAQLSDETLQFHRSVLWRGHRVRVA